MDFAMKENGKQSLLLKEGQFDCLASFLFKENAGF